MKYKKRLLITCRDPSTANVVNMLFKARMISKFTIFILVQRPASKIINIEYSKYCNEIKNYNNKQLYKITTAHVNYFQPDLILSGISGPGSGIDEIATKIAFRLKILHFSLQLFWGDYNKTIRKYYSNFIVFDNFAKKNTHKFFKSQKIYVVGNINYEKKIYVRKSNHNSQLKILILGQPFEEKRKYLNFIKKLILRLKKYNYKIYYKPHPKEDKYILKSIHSECKNITNDFFIEREKIFFQIIHKYNFVTSIFSTAMEDSIYAILFNKNLNLIPIYLNFNSFTNFVIKKYTGFSDISDFLNYSLILRESSDFDQFFRHDNFKKNREYISKFIGKNFKKSKNVSNKILKILNSD